MSAESPKETAASSNRSPALEPISATPPPVPTKRARSEPAAPRRPDPLIGKVLLDRVRIVKAIARGGMGQVYLGEQTKMNRRCAVKVLDPRFAEGPNGADFTRRFLLEASVASKVAHPNVVTIFDYGETPDGCFIAMEYLEGRSLSEELVQSGRVAPERAVRITQQVGRALREAHALGVVHRDVKPGNIFLVSPDDEDFVKVLDFGLVYESKATEDTGGPGEAIMGSPRYMAPEQVQGKEIDARADVYSLGVVLYAMLTGHPPFERRTDLATMMAQVSDVPPSIATAAPDLVLAPGLEGVVMRCLAKNPDDRFGSMEALVEALQLRGGAAPEASTGAPPEVPGAGRPPRATQPSPAERSSSSSPTRGGVSGTRSPESRVQELTPRRRRHHGKPSSQPVVVAAFIAVVAALTATALLDRTHAVPTTSPAAIVPAGLGPVPPATPLPAPAPAASRKATLHVTSDPPGAKVNEEGETLCASTPCDIVYAGDAADPATDHLLAFLLPGYRLESKAVKATGPAVTVTLERAR